MHPALVPADTVTEYTPVMEISAIHDMVHGDLTRVEQSLKQIVTPETALLVDAISHALGNNGKMLRPVLTLLASGTTAEITNAHIETAAVAELIHIATLLHDDVLDQADLRRGEKTVRAQWGNKIAILSGDYLLAQASLKLSHLDNCRLVSIFARVLSNLCEGEVEQMGSSYNVRTTWESYYKKTLCKTAALFGACCESAGVINGLPEHEIEALKRFGEDFGTSFQIVDDLLDYTATRQQLGKPVLDDLRNGILNAPVLIALDRLPAGSAEHKQLVSTLEGLFDAEEAAFPTLKTALFDLFEKADALNATEALARQFAASARESIAFLPDSPYRDALLSLTQYAFQRVS